MPDPDSRRLRWRCRRGMRELDHLLLAWLERRWAAASGRQRADFERLLEFEDDRLWRWCMGIERPDSEELHALVDELRTITEA